MADVTAVLSQIELGDPTAAERLFPLVYEELRQLAAARLMREQLGQTLQATALVHEAYVRLVDVEKAQHWNSRGHFFAAAAEAMRRLLVESARRKQAARRGGGRQRIDLDHCQVESPSDPVDILALDEALERLAATRAVLAQVVKLRFFGGLTMEQIAETLGISVATCHRHWKYARAWLHQEVSRAG
jgi:RNA polymerase sigma factor (TIGR02999 family)